MHVVGIIAEYNPYHSGHMYHIREVRRAFGEDCGVLCVMSGNWVQRGDAAITDKWARSAMALRGGADLILELPTVWAAASAEAFAQGAVSILDGTGLVDTLSFGSEAGRLSPLERATECLSSEAYRGALRRHLDQGLSFPLSRQYAADELLQEEADCLRKPNNNLGIEYLRALRHLGSPILPSTIGRKSVTHDSEAPAEGFASASYLREQLLTGQTAPLHPYLSPEDGALLKERGLYSLSSCTRGVFARLRSMTPEDFLSLPDCGEGLHNKLAQAARNSSTLEELYAWTKSRRYTHSRIRRLVLWAFLGLTAADRPDAPPYLRVLGMTQRGQTLLKIMKETAPLPILTKAAHVQRLPPAARRLMEVEARCTSLYDLCRADFGNHAGLSEFASNPVVL